MKRLFLILTMLAASAAAFAQTAPLPPQDNRAALDKAYEEARAAQRALADAEARRNQGLESQEGERTGTAAGGSRPNENYFARQAVLEQEVMQARRRYEEAMRRWNDLK